jgi:hypothetical protein
MNGSDEPESANRPQAVACREPPESLPNYGGRRWLGPRVSHGSAVPALLAASIARLTTIRPTTSMNSDFAPLRVSRSSWLFGPGENGHILNSRNQIIVAPVRGRIGFSLCSRTQRFVRAPGCHVGCHNSEHPLSCPTRNDTCSAAGERVVGACVTNGPGTRDGLMERTDWWIRSRRNDRRIE